jgi:hypothetical protein
MEYAAPTALEIVGDDVRRLILKNPQTAIASPKLK